MRNLQLTKAPIAKAGMLIRRLAAEVYEAFVNPDITTKFWFTKSSGRLETGKQVTWTWEMYNLSTQIKVRQVEKDRRILIEWGDPDETTTVEWLFTPYEEDATYVSITNSGFSGKGDDLVGQALDSVGGFTTVLDGAKAWLE